MSDQSDAEELPWDEDLASGSSESYLSKEGRKSTPRLRDAVHKSMLPRNFESLRKFFDQSENSSKRNLDIVGQTVDPTCFTESNCCDSGSVSSTNINNKTIDCGRQRETAVYTAVYSYVNKYQSRSSMTQYTKKETSEALKAFHEISYMKFKKISSSEEEPCCSPDSHVDSEDSGLFKEGYLFQRKSQPARKDTINKNVKKWKKTASGLIEHVNNLYKHGSSKNKETFSLPLGLEANRKVKAEPPDDGSSQCKSRVSGLYNTEDEMDVRRNDEFMREVRRVLRCKKNPQALEKRSLPEEYRRLIFKKTAFARKWGQETKALALTEKGEPSTENTGTGADGDNTSEPKTGIFEQLSKMVFKNKITKNSKAARQRNEVLKRVEEKRGFVDGEDNSDVDMNIADKTANEKNTKNKSEPQPGSSDPQIASNNGQHKISIENQDELQIAEPGEFLDLVELNDTTKRRLKKVESYLSSVSDVQSISPTLPEITELTSEREQSLFDSLAGEFLKNMAAGNDRKNKITRNDKKLLSIVVKRFIDRGQLAQIDEFMNSNISANILEVPPYENVTDREEFFLKKIIHKFIKRGMRNALEDLIAWIYYKLDAKKTKHLDKQERKAWSEKEVRDMVIAFKKSGKNSSMNRIVMQLLRDHKKTNPGLNARQITAVKEKIKDLVIERFARMYLERTKTDVDQSSEPFSLAVNVKNEFKMNSGMEQIDVNGKNVQIKWEFASVEGESEQPPRVYTEHETDQGSSVDESSPHREIEPCTQDRNTKAIQKNFIKEVDFVKERLKDIVWNVQQSYQRQKAGKANRTCSLVKKRSVTMIGDSNKVGKLNVKGKEKKLTFEERRKQMREEHVKWLLEQKEMLQNARKKEALNIEKFTQALPQRIENMIARRNVTMKKLDQRRAIDRNVKPWKK